MKKLNSKYTILFLALGLVPACSGNKIRSDSGPVSDGAADASDVGSSPGKDAVANGDQGSPDAGTGRDLATGRFDAATDPGLDVAADKVSPDAGPIPDGTTSPGNDVAFNGDAEGNFSDTPILERPVRGTYTCKVTRDRTSHSPLSWRNRAAIQSLTDGSIAFARVQWETNNSDGSWIVGPRSFLASSIAMDGSFGSSTTIPVVDVNAIANVAMAPRGEGIALAWVDATSLQFAAFDGKGTLVVQPRLITTLEVDPQIQLQMASDPSGTGFALTFIARNSDKGYEARVVFLDADGGMRGSMLRLGARTTKNINPAPSVTAVADGYGFVWFDFDQNRVLFVETDASGKEIVAPRAVSSITDDSILLEPVSFERPGARIVAMAGGFVAAWSEVKVSATSPEGWAVLRLIRLDPKGAPIGVSATMRAPENKMDEVEPVLTPFGDALAVTWGHGTHIEGCGGCVPDHRIDFVLIDPQNLTPLSQPVSITNGGGVKAGGLLNKQVAVSGSSFLTLYDLTFHVDSKPGSAVFTCTH